MGMLSETQDESTATSTNDATASMESWEKVFNARESNISDCASDLSNRDAIAVRCQMWDVELSSLQFFLTKAQAIRNGCITVNLLPPEILSLMFEWAVPQDSSSRAFKMLMPVVLSHVCRHWRRVAFANKLLWTYISLNAKKEVVRAFLEKASSAPVHFSLNSTQQYAITEPKIFIRKHQHHLRSLSIGGHKRAFRVLDLVLDADAPELRAVTLRMFEPNPVCFPALRHNLLDYPNLLRILFSVPVLCLHGFLFPWTRIFERLFQLELRPLLIPENLPFSPTVARTHLVTLPDLLEGLRNMPHLDRLLIEDGLCPPEPDFQKSQVRLPNLRRELVLAGQADLILTLLECLVIAPESSITLYFSTPKFTIEDYARLKSELRARYSHADTPKYSRLTIRDVVDSQVEFHITTDLDRNPGTYDWKMLPLDSDSGQITTTRVYIPKFDTGDGEAADPPLNRSYDIALLSPLHNLKHLSILAEKQKWAPEEIRTVLGQMQFLTILEVSLHAESIDHLFEVLTVAPPKEAKGTASDASSNEARDGDPASTPSPVVFSPKLQTLKFIKVNFQLPSTLEPCHSLCYKMFFAWGSRIEAGLKMDFLQFNKCRLPPNDERDQIMQRAKEALRSRES